MHCWSLEWHCQSLKKILSIELDVLWVTGGYGGNVQWLSSSELIGPGGSSEGPELPIEVEEHCLVRLDESRVMMIGGFDNTNYETSANTHIYDFDTETWSNGPALNQARKLLGCGTFTSAAHGGKTMVVVAGGYFLMDSVEFWDPTGDEGWIQGTVIKLYGNQKKIYLTFQFQFFRPCVT